MHTHIKGRFRNAIFGTGLHPESATVAVLVMLLFLLFLLLFIALAVQPARAQSYDVFHNFSGEDGVFPTAQQDFTGGPAAGAFPSDGVTLAPNGKICGSRA